MFHQIIKIYQWQVTRDLIFFYFSVIFFLNSSDFLGFLGVMVVLLISHPDAHADVHPVSGVPVDGVNSQLLFVTCKFELHVRWTS